MAQMSHACHANNCKAEAPPKMFMCKPHWFRLPRRLRDAIWDAYVSGQEDRKDPSSEYIDIAREAIDWLEEHGGSK